MSLKKAPGPVILCIALILPAMGWAIPRMVQASDDGLSVDRVTEWPDKSTEHIQMGGDDFLFDRVIEWPDKSTEHIQLSDDGFFVLDGVKKRLVGMFIGLTSTVRGDSYQYYLPENMAILENELAYLESAGVRIIHVPLRYVRWWLPEIEDEEKALTAVLDLAYEHKMLVIPQIEGKNKPNFGNLEEFDFSWPIGGSRYEDSMVQWTERWTEYISRYPNVVAVVIDNELDLPFVLRPLPFLTIGQRYKPAAVEDYLHFITGIIRSRVDVPIVHKLTSLISDNPEIKLACLRATDFPAFDCYGSTAEVMGTRVAELLQWVGSSGFAATGWWCLEVGSGEGRNVDATDFNVGYVENVFAHGASLAMLFCDYTSVIPEASLFDVNGSPAPELVAILQDIERLQAPIVE